MHLLYYVVWPQSTAHAQILVSWGEKNKCQKGPLHILCPCRHDQDCTLGWGGDELAEGQGMMMDHIPPTLPAPGPHSLLWDPNLERSRELSGGSCSRSECRLSYERCPWPPLTGESVKPRIVASRDRRPGFAFRLWIHLWANIKLLCAFISPSIK